MKNVIVGSAALLLIGCWMIFFILPMNDKVHDLKSDISYSLQQLKLSLVMAGSIDTLKKKNANARERIARLEKRLLSPNQLPEVLTSIAKLGKKNRLRVTSVQPEYKSMLNGRVIKGSDVLVVPVEIRVNGAFKNLGNFVDRLGSQFYLFSIKDIQMSVTNGSYPGIESIVKGQLFLTREKISRKSKV